MDLIKTFYKKSGPFVATDFNYFISEYNHPLVKLEEINKMIEYGVLTLDEDKLLEYKFDTTVSYNKERYTKDEAFEMWKNNVYK